MALESDTTKHVLWNLTVVVVLKWNPEKKILLWKTPKLVFSAECKKNSKIALSQRFFTFGNFEKKAWFTQVSSFFPSWQLKQVGKKRKFLKLTSRNDSWVHFEKLTSSVRQWARRRHKLKEMKTALPFSLFSRFSWIVWNKGRSQIFFTDGEIWREFVLNLQIHVVRWLRCLHPVPRTSLRHLQGACRSYRKYPRIMHNGTFSTKILTSKLGVHIICGLFVYTWVCWKIPHLWFKSWGAHFTWAFTVSLLAQENSQSPIPDFIQGLQSRESRAQLNFLPPSLGSGVFLQVQFLPPRCPKTLGTVVVKKARKKILAIREPSCVHHWLQTRRNRFLNDSVQDNYESNLMWWHPENLHFLSRRRRAASESGLSESQCSHCYCCHCHASTLISALVLLFSKSPREYWSFSASRERWDLVS